jgi:hypothetical protein
LSDVDNFKVGRPKYAIFGGALAIFCGLLGATLLSLGLSATGYEFSEDFMFFYISCGLVVAGGVSILRRHYMLGGIFVLVFGIIVMIDAWYVGIWGLIGGILGVISKENTPEKVLHVARQYGRVNIRQIATEIGKTEADVELAIISLQAKGQPVKFDKTTRDVIYN